METLDAFNVSDAEIDAYLSEARDAGVDVVTYALREGYAILETIESGPAIGRNTRRSPLAS